MGSYDPIKDRMLDIPSDESNLLEQSLRKDFEPDQERFDGKNFDREKLNDKGVWRGDFVAGDPDISSDDTIKNLNAEMPNVVMNPNKGSAIK